MLATPRVAPVITNRSTSASALAASSSASRASVHSPIPSCGLKKLTPASASRGIATSRRQVVAPHAPPRNTCRFMVAPPCSSHRHGRSKDLLERLLHALGVLGDLLAGVLRDVLDGLARLVQALVGGLRQLLGLLLAL